MLNSAFKRIISYMYDHSNKQQKINYTSKPKPNSTTNRIVSIHISHIVLINCFAQNAKDKGHILSILDSNKYWR